MATTKDLILDHAQALKKIRRMAFEIYEQNFGETEVVLVGIYDTGFLVAEMLKKALEDLTPLQVQLVEMRLTKSAPVQSDVQLNTSVDQLQHKVVVLVDDVLSTGKTLVYGLRPFLKISVKKLQVAVLVDREHRSFPISADYVGYGLSTTINQHIEVQIGHKGDISVYLF